MVSKHLSSRLPPPRRKEKTMDELIDKIKATEAASPPRAKPGRKSKSAAEEDTKEKKRYHLNKIIDSLYNEITFVKTELLRHKDCN
ncbi:hypothetical protein DERF_008940 [Dermatophagoides farinae]|uniref:Uncharacterized protein n=1 Tax=Dermatophagoides farinae TaxID=6954 RepID=A0A922HT18_DERFA|nr:hypothetical protein DERF_008940 [Dermatophagoides farinae]